MRANHWFCPAIAAGCMVAALLACSSKSPTNTDLGLAPGDTDYAAPDGAVAPLESPGTCAGATGGSVVGPQDDHCQAPDGGRIVQVTTAAGCTAGPDAAPPSSDDGGATTADAGNCGDSNFGATMFNNGGSDDDCKYDVSWQSTPICEGQPVYFTVLVTKRADGTPLEGVETGGTFVSANPRPDVVLACDHPIPNAPAPRDPSPAVAPGTYVVGPVVFDQPGQWVFRFHFNSECLDNAPDSPHGHAAFWVDVP